jgi:hypothetical protein
MQQALAAASTGAELVLADEVRHAAANKDVVM